MHSVVKKTEIYQFEIGIEINKLKKEVLLKLSNPRNTKILQSFERYNN